MKIIRIVDLHADAGWRVFSFLKIETDAGIVGWTAPTPAAPAEVALIVPMRSGRHKADHQKDARQRAAADALAVVDADLN